MSRRASHAGLTARRAGRWLLPPLVSARALGYALTGLTLLEHEGTGEARHWFGNKGWPLPSSRAARLPVSGVVTGSGSEIEPGIRKSQNPSPQWGRQVVVQVCTGFYKRSILFCKHFFPLSPRSCDQRVALLLSEGD